jgi:hypothetical protein
MVRSYEQGTDDVTGFTGLIHNAYLDTLYEFNRAEFNSILANYTTQYYDLREGQIRRFEDLIPGQGGLLNGRMPQSVYGLWGNAGAMQGGRYPYQQFESQQFGVNAMFSAYLGNHEIRFGMQHEQLFERGYFIGPTGLWTIMRGLTNFHIEQLDKANPEAIYMNGTFMDTVNYFRLYDGASQRAFDLNLRRELGLPVNGLDYLLIDSYDFNTNLLTYYDRDMIKREIRLDNGLNINMFSADELLENGNYTAFYYGYDYTGTKVTTKPSLDDFFTKRDERGDFARPIGAFEPIYMAGYIQDKFAFRDLIFNIGLRVDRFDANQPVLNDPFLLYSARTVQEVTMLGGESVFHPGNMGSEYVVYVDQVNDPTRIMGYRNGFVWYNAEGVEVQDPQTLDAGEGVSPFLVNPDQGAINSSAFKDYEPQWSVMPRISFSFPISDEALFFAHYDVLTQRPLGNIRSNPADYFFINNIGGRNINNPDLKPTKTIDYELGFQQVLTNKSSLRLTAFYREMRDDIQVYRFSGAYPRDYTSYNNIDFGTVKGFTLTYDLRRLNSNTRLNANYTLQFADGTGSSSTTAQALINAGLPNLRVANPVNWDRRHNFTLSFDYRYGSGQDYSGPVVTRKKGTDNEKSVQLLQNTGVNFQLIGGSGTPYTAQENITSLTSGGTRILKGTINGSRLPWQFRLDMRLDRDIYLKSSSGGSTKYLNVYLQVLNLLDTKNILGVYPATGVPDDDGYLAAAEWQRQISEQLDPESYRTLYALALNAPGNYSSPRQIRLGVMFNF